VPVSTCSMHKCPVVRQPAAYAACLANARILIGSPGSGAERHYKQASLNRQCRESNTPQRGTNRARSVTNSNLTT